MSPNSARIRICTDDDREQILAVHRTAFGDEEGPLIAKLVAEMLDDPTGEPIFSLGAELGGKLVGHILFTSVTLEPNGIVPAHILAPLAVASEHQGQGIGSTLIEEGLTQLTAAEVQLVFVLGYPDYYSRFGFVPAGARGFDAPYPIAAKNADAWMVHQLSPGAIDQHQGTVRCCRALDQPQHWQE